MSVFSSPIVLCAGGLILVWRLHALIQERRNNPNRLPLPPGPKGYPIIGNLFDVPTYRPWLVYDKWFKIYGDMIYFTVFGQSYLILGTLERTYDLFEKRSSNYSDRPRMPMVVEMMRWDHILTFIPYGSWWRRHRRLFHDHFHPNIVHKYQPFQIKSARAFLRRLLKSPDDFMLHVRHAFASTIVKITYGETIQEENDPYVTQAEIALTGLAEAGNPGSFLVDTFPAMKYIPDWFPGAGWKKKAAWWRHINDIVANQPWNLVKEKIKQGTAEPCIATALISQLPDENTPKHAEEDIIARNTCAVAFAGGADTTVSSVQSFFMAMCLYPEAQKKAQAELDRVLGGRLPEFNDRPNLPYINAMVKESMRWQLVVPLAVGHMSSNADEYNGYYIPKGTVLLGNAWTILHDPETFSDPLTYNPDRFLKDGKIDPTVRDPTVAFFGFGRRICPGRFFAENSLFCFITHLLAVYDIRPSLDKDGKEIEIKPEMTSGLLSYPEPFTCRITPRSKKAEELIRGLILVWWLHALIQKRRNNPNRLPLPPGPKGYPVISSLFDLPTYRPWLVYDEWFKTYGDMIYFTILGQSFLILGSLERMYDLFEKRSSNYSDRPPMPMVMDMMRWDYIMSFLSYGSFWRRHRRLFHDHFHPSIVHKYQPAQIQSARAFLRRLLKSPDHFMHHVRHAFASTIVKIAYSETVQEENDPYVTQAEIALTGLAEAGNPGSFLVDIFPAMKYIPDWFPGAGWKRKAALWQHINDIVANKYGNMIKEKIKQGTAEACIATTLISQLPDEDAPNFVEEDTAARGACAVAFVGGADTTVSTVQAFFMAMCLYPEAQRKAQAELDRVLGGRLPEFNDRPNLLYINATVKESMRWQLVAPLAIAHMNSDADEYNGYYIPKGTLVIGNAWTILHDPEVYPDPLVYNPDRFLKDGKIDPAVRDPTVAFFGFGRRICLGRFFTEASLFSIITHLLAVYDIRPGLDKDGNEVEIKPDMTSGLLSYPEPFACRIIPRSKKAEELIRNSGLMD